MQGLDHVLKSYTYRYVCICIKVFSLYVLYVTLTVSNFMILHII